MARAETRRTLVSLAATLAGLGLFAWFAWRTGPERILEALGRIGWLALLVPLPQAVVYLFDTLGWKASFRRESDTLSLGTLYRLRMIGEAVNYLTPTAYVGGEPVKAWVAARHGVPAAEAAASVVVAKTLMTLAELLFVGIGAICALGSITPGSGVFWGIGVVIAGGALLVTLLFWIQARGALGAVLALVRRLGIRLRALESREGRIRQIDAEIRRFYAEERRRFVASVGWHLAGWLTGAVEVYLVAGWLGAPLGVLDAIAIEAFAAVVKGATLFVPGSVGFQETGFLFLFPLFRRTAEAGAGFGILRRARELFFSGVGVLWYYLEERRLPFGRRARSSGRLPDAAADTRAEP